AFSQRVHVITVLGLMGLSTSAHPGPGFPGGFRISDLGPPGDPEFDAFQPALVYNSVANEFLVVWHGDTGAGPIAYAVFGQRIDAATGAEIGRNDLRIGATGQAYVPDVAYNSAANEYLIVWYENGYEEGDVREIYAQRLDADGNQIGIDDAQMSGTGHESPCVTNHPDVIYNSQADEYLVLWAAGCPGNIGIFGQRLDTAGAEIGADDFRVDDGKFSAGGVALAYNDQADEYLVVWRESNTAFDAWVVSRRLDAAGRPLSDERVISESGNFWSSPEVAYNTMDDEYLVVWSADSLPSLAEGEFEIIGQRLDVLGNEIGGDDFRISDMGSDGNPAIRAEAPDVAYGPIAREYLVVWAGDDDTAPLVDDEYEVYGQRLDAGGVEIGPNDFRISRMGSDGDPAFGAKTPAADYSHATGEFLVAWSGDDDSPPQVQGEKEIFIRRLGCPWDCGDDDGTVGTVDLQMLLAQWGQLGTCDANGGGVSTTDLLELLAAWGPCP
ncbi:MAG: hypothetical protein ACYS0D_10350, partial [Planctomycetota bacterium]